METLWPSIDGGRLGRTSDTVFWILDTAAAHAEAGAAVEENSLRAVRAF